VSLSTQVTGTLPVANGGTGAISASAALTSLGASPATNPSGYTANTGTVTSVAGTGSINGITLSGTVTSSGSLTLGGALSGISLTTQVTGTLGAASGGTGLTTPGTSGNVLTSNGSAWVSQIAPSLGGTVSLDNGSIAAPSLRFTGETDMGMSRDVSGGRLLLSVGGVQAMSISSSSSANPALATSLGVGAGTGIAGQSCTAIGNGAIGGASAAASTSCTAVGYQALRSVTGASNTALGGGAGFSITSGSNNTCIGHTAAASAATVSNEITLGNSSVTALRCQVTTITSLSDARDKTDIAALDAGLAFINSLNPVRFTWNMRPEEDFEGNLVQGRVGDEDTGFIAQELKAAQDATGIVIPGLVYDSNPDKLEAGYGKLLPVLVKAIQELSAKVEALEAQLGS